MNTTSKNRFRMRRFKALLATGALVAAMGLSATANANPLTINSVVGGAPTGTTHENFDSLTKGDTTTATLPSGITVSFATDGQPAQGSVGGVYAAPYLSGGNGLGFGLGGTNQADGADATVFLSTGVGSVTLTFPTAEKYMGLLWGSVDTYNTLTFYDGANNIIGTITGTDVNAAANGDQGANGTFYVNIISSDAFYKVVATSSSYAFEFDNVAFNGSPMGVPEPGAWGMFLLGLLLVGSGCWLRGRKLA
ncbi:MAG TPA: PEP-CTERM sorting domain-containing protein [Rhodanobacteraceae bacterium]|nr:PEP-CTERM sorting domain-containing protein [Rhodanobacteraceae bacterium]